MGLKTNSTTVSLKKRSNSKLHATALHSSAFTSCDFQKHEQTHYIKNKTGEHKGPKENDMLQQTTNQLPFHIMLSKKVIAMSCHILHMNSHACV